MQKSIRTTTIVVFLRMARFCGRAEFPAFLCAAALSFLPVNAGRAEDSVWVNSVGEAAADEARPLKEVKEEALFKARRAAIEQVVGVKIQSETVLRNFDLQADFVESLSAGHIIEEKIEKWETELVKGGGTGPPAPVYRVYMKAKVALERGRPDPSFKIHASANRRVFKDGDEVKINIKSTKDCYITIFVLTENNDAYLIFPNERITDNYIGEGEDFVYPSNDEGLTLKARLLPGCDRAREYLKIIATKKPIRFTPDFFVEGINLASFTRETASLRELLKELMMIPADERTETLIAYEIMK